MGLFATIKRWVNMLFQSKAKEEFNVDDILSGEMRRVIGKCINIYRGAPEWLDDEDHITTVNFAKTICAETARLTTLGMGITIDGGARAETLQDQINGIMKELRRWTELGLAFGTIVLKPDGTKVDAYRPDEVMVTDCKGDKVTGMVFYNHDIDQTGKIFYTRLEYHHLGENGTYEITNICYAGSSRNDMGKQIDIDLTPWAGMDEYAVGVNITRPLFAVLTTPNSNNVDFDSPFGLPVYMDAIQELKDLDIAYSRYVKEINDSKRTVLLDSDVMTVGGKTITSADGLSARRKELGLPDMIKNVSGDGVSTFYQEINPSLNTDARLSGINALLSQIGYKIGFSNGYFVFNEKTGFSTATQVESEQARTIQYIEDIRRQLEVAIYDLIYALNVFADINGESAREEFNENVFTDESERKIHIHFMPIYSNKEEDRARMLTLVNSGFIPKAYYLHLYEGMSMDEAEKLVAEASAGTSYTSLFGDE